MSALPLPLPVVEPDLSPFPAPLRRLLERAWLAAPPSSLGDLHLDTDVRVHARKTLLAFTAERAHVNLFVLLSPALRRTRPDRTDGGPPRHHSNVEQAQRAPPRARAAWGSEAGQSSAACEPDFPWWCPERHGPARRYAYSTPHFDFVEVVVPDAADRVFVRIIN